MFSFVSLPLLHVGGPEPTGPLYTHWILDPRIALFIFGVTGAYLLWAGPLNRRRAGVDRRPVTQSQIRWFLLGSLVLLIALGPPLDDWSHFFFVSAHMLQHLLLMFVVIPCWIKGIPSWFYQPIIDRGWSRWLLTWMPRVVPAFAIVTLIMALWHVPALYDATLRSEVLHTTQHLFFLLAGFLFYWPLMSTRLESPQLSPALKCLYLFVQTIPAGIIGALITYAGPGLYPHYEQATVRPWGIGLKVDQEMAGLTMWVGMNTLFLGMLTVIFLRWAGREERADFDALREESRVKRQQSRDAIAEPKASGLAQQ
jgi:cytochrome c oxidase assembly factor CtaG